MKEYIRKINYLQVFTHFLGRSFIHQFQFLFDFYFAFILELTLQVPFPSFKGGCTSWNPHTTLIKFFKF